MYAPEEGVAHEWFEIFNNGENDIDITEWRFNDGSNHIFEKPPKNGGQGSLVISSGAYAIVAKEADAFLSAHQGFNGTVIDGSFSLTDTGDTLTLIDESGVIIDSVSYSDNAGAKKNGLSFQLIDGVWSSAAPTPGEGTLNTSEEDSDDNAVITGDDSGITSGTANSFPVEPQIFSFAGDDRTVTVGADTEFKGRAVGLEGKPLTGARFVWSFGDGGRKEGQSVLYHYRYPGTYTVALEVSSGEYTAIDRVTVAAREADIAITEATSEVITLANYGDYELNLSWWILESGTAAFMLPEHTLILSEHEIQLPGTITGLRPAQKEDLVLKYPNGIPVLLLQSSEPQFENKPISNIPSSQRSIVGMSVPIVSPDSLENISNENTDSFKGTQQIGAVLASVERNEERNSGMVLWIFALAGMIVLGSAGALFLRYQSREDITIID